MKQISEWVQCRRCKGVEGAFCLACLGRGGWYAARFIAEGEADATPDPVSRRRVPASEGNE